MVSLLVFFPSDAAGPVMCNLQLSVGHSEPNQRRRRRDYSGYLSVSGCLLDQSSCGAEDAEPASRSA